MIGRDKHSQEFIKKENKKTQDAKDTIRYNFSENKDINKEGFIPTFFLTREQYYARNKKFRGTKTDRELVNNVYLKDNTIYENYDDDNFALILELANFLPIDDIVRITEVDREVVERVIKRANKTPVQHFDKPPIVIWLPRFMWRFVDLVNLQYNPKWVEEAKEAFFKTLKKIRSKTFRV